MLRSALLAANNGVQRDIRAGGTVIQRVDVDLLGVHSDQDSLIALVVTSVSSVYSSMMVSKMLILIFNPLAGL